MTTRGTQRLVVAPMTATAKHAMTEEAIVKMAAAASKFICMHRTHVFYNLSSSINCQRTVYDARSDAEHTFADSPTLKLCLSHAAFIYLIYMYYYS